MNAYAVCAMMKTSASPVGIGEAGTFSLLIFEIDGGQGSRRVDMQEVRRDHNRDIEDREDIEQLVVTFYQRAFKEEVLGPIFVDIVKMDLEAHLPIMCDFWETVLFQAGLYRRSAFQVHVDINRLEPLTPMHFQRWLDLWEATVDELFTGEKANLAKLQASRIGGSIRRRLERTVDTELFRLSPSRTAG